MNQKVYVSRAKKAQCCPYKEYAHKQYQRMVHKFVTDFIRLNQIQILVGLQSYGQSCTVFKKNQRQDELTHVAAVGISTRLWFIVIEATDHICTVYNEFNAKITQIWAKS